MKQIKIIKKHLKKCRIYSTENERYYFIEAYKGNHYGTANTKQNQGLSYVWLKFKCCDCSCIVALNERYISEMIEAMFENKLVGSICK